MLLNRALVKQSNDCSERVNIFWIMPSTNDHLTFQHLNNFVRERADEKDLKKVMIVNKIIMNDSKTTKGRKF